MTKLKRIATIMALTATLFIPEPAQASIRLVSLTPVSTWEANWKTRVAATGGPTIGLINDWREFRSLLEPDTQPISFKPAPPVQHSVPGRVERWRPLVEKYFQPEDVATALKIMDCESKGKPDAENPLSSATGLFQHLKGWYHGHWGPAFDPYDPEQSVAAAARMRYDRGNWNDWIASRECWR